MVDVIQAKLRRGLSSKWFFYGTIGFFVLQATWIALSAAYPQAFDEDYHFGLIQIYSHYWLPFLSHQPPTGDTFGAVARDPSYLFYFLLSFVYRLLVLVHVYSQTAQVIVLRFCNILFFAGGLLLFRRVLRRIGLSALATNTVISIITLIPITPQLAGQINYDNLLFLVAAILCLLSFNLIDQLHAKRFSIATVLLLAAFGMLGTLVKYEFAPIFFCVTVYFLWRAVLTFRHHWREAARDAYQNWHLNPGWRRGVIITITAISLILFVQRIGINIIAYHTLAPDCAKVLSVKDCHQYYVWAHDYDSHELVVQDPNIVSKNLLWYIAQWGYWLWYRLIFAVSGPGNGYQNFPPLPVPAATLACLIIAAIAALFIAGKRIYTTNRYALFLSVMVIFYLGVLFVNGLAKYRYTDVLELMNGRYLLPVLVPAAAVAVIGLGLLLRSKLKPIIAFVAIAGMLYGGGVFTFILRSGDGWFWQNNTVIRTNNAARSALKHVIYEADNSYQTKEWFFN